MKNECNSIKSLTALCPGIKCHSRFLSYFDTSMTIANASNGILKNTQSERPFKQIIVASLSTSLSCSRHSVWFSNNTEAISKLEIERKVSGYNKGKSSQDLLDQICNRGCFYTVSAVFRDMNNNTNYFVNPETWHKINLRIITADIRI